MASKQIAIPEKVYDRLESRKATRQPFSGVIEELLEEVEK